MSQIISACGLLCNECGFFGKRCDGCCAVKGETFWAKKATPDRICPLYKCSVVERKYDNCGRCAELPCGKFTGLKDPNISEEQHARSIQERVSRLK
ncbi:MAG TPA: DUF3795 domain-containing protein [Spirochaetota bacterium]|nr:DUF3795 domain-containing protein [Spirochaetota bacterium]HPC41394.1 DUF3795 domain-containing protein [Spirochaetota bacterium]HPL16503.1 DUF3795 domain-containing protein [Spirochaetota bacterium]HQF09224.1 DUF3795 domain-containing protein [Spirochaetota bacterium]HQH97765.1 DUF3795 domain-containing protein [Spirochaetota bacterium]